MKASVVIVTKDRKTELRRAIASALRQGDDVQVVVIDDGSKDGTAAMVSEEFPRVRLVTHADSAGYIRRRNEGAEVASGQVLFSIDDDAEFATPDVVSRTLLEFDTPRVAAVAIPYTEPKKDNRVGQKAPDNQDTWVTDTFIGTAHAIRREIFLTLRGYRADLLHQGEERDFTLRLLRMGYVVRLGEADLIIHNESPKRDFTRMDFYGRRNDILFAWHNVPLPYLPAQLFFTTLNGLRHCARTGRWRAMLHGLAAGYGLCARRWQDRHPVDARTFRLYRALKKRGPLPLKRIDSLLPSLPVCDGRRRPLNCRFNPPVKDYDHEFH